MVAIPQQAFLAGRTPGNSDPFFSSTKLLMGYEGANGATSGVGFLDESPGGHSSASNISNQGVISTAQFAFGASSLLCNGSTKLAYVDHADWHLSNGLFTVEAIVRPTTVVGTQMFVGQFGDATPNLGWSLYMNGAALNWNVSTTGSDNLNDLSGGTMVANTQNYVAVDFDGTTYRLYRNGAVLATSATLRTIFNPGVILSIGSNSGGTLAYSGFIDELRITKGVARYAGAYSVQTAAFPRS